MKRRGFIGRVLAALGVGATGVGLPVRVGASQQHDKPLGAPPAPPCPRCEGTGEILWPAYDLRWSHEYEGARYLPDSDHWMRPCPECACSRCKGRGTIGSLPSGRWIPTRPCPVCQPTGKTYFVDPENGDNSNSGLSPDRAWSADWVGAWERLNDPNKTPHGNTIIWPSNGGGW